MWDLIVSVPDHCLPFYFGSPRSESEVFWVRKNAKKELRQRIRRENFLQREALYSNLMANPDSRPFHTHTHTKKY